MTKLFKTTLRAAIASLKASNKVKSDADVLKDLGYKSKGTLSAYASGLVEISDEFKNKFEEFYKLKLSSFEDMVIKEGEVEDEKEMPDPEKPGSDEQINYKDKYLNLLERYNANSEELKEMIEFQASLQKAEMELLLFLSQKQGGHKEQGEILEKYGLDDIFGSSGK